jgi:hypothetical protein
MITANYDALLHQAHATVGEYLREAVRYIDEELGDGYAKKNPALVAAFIQTAASDYNAACQAVAIQEIALAISGTASEENPQWRPV